MEKAIIICRYAAAAWFAALSIIVHIPSAHAHCHGCTCCASHCHGNEIQAGHDACDLCRWMDATPLLAADIPRAIKPIFFSTDFLTEMVSPRYGVLLSSDARAPPHD